jgi:biofilm PGA synthesis N-glycosyltransferase PgaC
VNENGNSRTIDRTVVSYVVVTPVRNEADYIEKTIRSMISQTIPPCEWIIVNDGSTDGTEEIVRKYLEAYPWIRLVNRKDRGFHQRGGGVVVAFYEGYNVLKCQDYDFIVKLDGDLSFATNYFEDLFKRFMAFSELGIAGGKCWLWEDNQWMLKKGGENMPPGCTKVYRKECFEAIGGLERHLGWDGIDNWKAQMLGWQTHCFDDLRVIHPKPMGNKAGLVRRYIEMGRAAYFIGYHPLFMLARGVRNFGYAMGIL